MSDHGASPDSSGSQPWTTPGASAPQPQPPPPAPGTTMTGAHGDVGAEDELPLPPIEFRPMTVADILDGAFEMLKRRPREVLGFTAVFVIPIQVVSAVLLRDHAGLAVLGIGSDSGSFFDIDLMLDEDDAESAGPSLLWMAGLMVISACGLALAAGALCLLLSDWLRNTRRSPASIVWITVKRSPVLIAGVLVVKVCEAIGYLGLGIGAYVAMVYLHVVSPAIMAEGIGPFAAVRRSMRLTSTRAGTTFVLPLLVGLVGMAVTFGLLAIGEIALFLVGDDLAWVVFAASDLVSSLITVPFTAAVAIIYYFDLRIRSEGLDIEERARAVLPG